jgi:hypothetical protein
MGMQYLLFGIFVGFFASSFLAMLSVEPVLQAKPSATMLSSIPLRKKGYSKYSTPGSFAPLTESKSNDNDGDDGWHAIHVFYGNSTHIGQASKIPPQVLAKSESRRWFSQLQQDELVSRLLRGKRDGYFVDLAANDAIRISNTYALENFFGWHGLCIEANPVYWPSLAYRKNCVTVAAVVGEFPNRAAPKGGIVGANFDNSKKTTGGGGEDQLRYTVTLEHILDRFRAPSVMDYLSLDVEGAETYVMASFPFDRYRFHLLTVERPDEKLCRLLLQHGYRLLKQLHSWGETIWMHELAETLVDLDALREFHTETYVYSEAV